MSETEAWGFEDEHPPYVFIKRIKHEDGTFHTEIDPPNYRRRRRHPMIWVPLEEGETPEDYYRLLSRLGLDLKTSSLGKNDSNGYEGTWGR